MGKRISGRKIDYASSTSCGVADDLAIFDHANLLQLEVKF